MGSQERQYARVFLKVFVKGGLWHSRYILLGVFCILVFLGLILVAIETQNALGDASQDNNEEITNPKVQSPQNYVNAVVVTDTVYQDANAQLLASVNNLTDRISYIEKELGITLQGIQLESKGGLQGETIVDRVINAEFAVFYAATLGVGDYDPHSHLAKTVLVISGGLGMLLFGMLGGIAFAAANAAFHRLKSGIKIDNNIG